MYVFSFNENMVTSRFMVLKSCRKFMVEQ